MDSTTLDAAVAAVNRGLQVIPIQPRDKRPSINSWTAVRWEPDSTPEQIKAQFDAWNAPDDGNLGVLLGEPSRLLLDVDLDHYRATRLKDYFLPPTPARSGRAGKPNSHYWYYAEAGTLPGTRQFLMPRTSDGRKGGVIVELRSTGAQTVLPPSIHPSQEAYTWSTEPWGGEKGPATVNGRRLATQVALLALATVLMDAWPAQGSRHEAYLALAGGLLRDGDNGVHPYWEKNVSVLIRALAQATLDDDGPDSREAESVGSTIRNLRAGKPVYGFPKLAEIIGDEHVAQVRVLVAEVESSAGVVSRQAASIPQIDLDDEIRTRDTSIGAIDADDRDPLEERIGTWEPVDLQPYLTGRVKPVLPSIMQRDDGQSLMYPGRVNMMYGSSESAKSWIALFTCIQVMSRGERVMYLDFEDEPVNTLNRLKLLGADPDDLQRFFSYVRPESPLAPMQRDRWGKINQTEEGKSNLELLNRALLDVDPVLIVADGMTVLYGLHGLDTNDAVSTDIITGWLKQLTRNGRTSVIIIDHTSKGAEKGSTPIGSQHKQAMVQGSMLQVWMVQQPMPGAIGQVELVVLKDRPGEVRKISVQSGTKAQVSAIVTLDSTNADRSVMTIAAPPNASTQAAKLASDAAEAARKRAEEDKVLAVFKGDVDLRLSKLDVLKGIGMAPADATNLRDVTDNAEKYWEGVLGRLVDKNYLQWAGKTQAKRWWLTIGMDDPNATLTLDFSNQPNAT